MKIGVISDSHDHMAHIEKFVTMASKDQFDMVLHCGDFCSPFVARKFTNLPKNVIFHGIRGNNDGDITHLNHTFSNIGKIREGHQVLDIEGKTVLMLHGHAISEEMIVDIAKQNRYDLVLYGHFHHTRNEQFGSTLLVNPGESCGYLTGEATCAIVEIPKTGKVTAKIVSLV